MKILTTSPDFSRNGNWRHIYELEKTLPNLCKWVGLNKIQNAIDNENPQLVIMAGSPTKRYELIANQCKNYGDNTKSAILFCSPFGQAELSNEVACLSTCIEWLENETIDYLFVGSQRMENSLKKSLPRHEKKIWWLPQTANLDNYPEVTENKMKGHISLITGKMPHKNALNQLTAARLADKTVHTNSLTPQLRHYSNQIGLKYYSYEWLPREQYLELISKMECGLQVSFSEAFNYVALDHLMMRTPMIISEYNFEWDNILSQINMDDPKVIMESILNTANMAVVSDKFIMGLEKEMERRKKIAESVLNNCIEEN